MSLDYFFWIQLSLVPINQLVIVDNNHNITTHSNSNIKLADSACNSSNSFDFVLILSWMALGDVADWLLALYIDTNNNNSTSN